MFRYRTLRSDIRFSALPNGTYYFCAQCDLWLNRPEVPPAPGAVCRYCGTPWAQAQGIWRKGVPGPLGAPARPRRWTEEERWLAFWFVASVALGILLAAIAYPVVKRLLGSGSFWAQLAVAVGATSLFCLILTLLVLVLLLVVQAPRSGFNPTVTWQRAFRTLGRHRWRIGLPINLVASVGSLWFVCWFLQRGPTYGDYALQLLVALLIQGAIQRWWGRYVGAIRRILG